MHEGHDDDERADGAADEHDAERALARRVILQRRNRFIAAALAGVGLGAGCASTSTPPTDAGRRMVDASGDSSAGRGGHAGQAGRGGQISDAGHPRTDGAAQAADAGASDDAGPRDARVIDVKADAAPRVCLTPTF